MMTSAPSLPLSLALTLLLTCQAATIFPEDDLGVNYMAKRQINPDCYRCLTSFDSSYSGACLRCWGARFGAVVPFHSKRSYGLDEAESSAYDDGLQANAFLRTARSAGCGCCISTRMTNDFCCSMCATAAKRVGKRSVDHAPRPS